MSQALKIIASNKKARHNFTILDTFEAGLVLSGTEVKSLRTNSVNLKEGFVQFKNNEAFVIGMHIPPYKHGNRENHHPFAKRKLLLNKLEIRRLKAKVREQGMTLVPLRLYFKGGKAKLEIALVQSKKKYDKRQALKKADAKREVSRAMKYKKR